MNDKFKLEDALGKLEQILQVILNAEEQRKGKNTRQVCRINYALGYTVGLKNYFKGVRK